MDTNFSPSLPPQSEPLGRWLWPGGRARGGWVGGGKEYKVIGRL